MASLGYREMLFKNKTKTQPFSGPQDESDHAVSGLSDDQTLVRRVHWAADTLSNLRLTG